MRVFAKIGAAIVLAGTAAPAGAQVGGSDILACHMTGAEAIAGCTAAITSGKWDGRNLASLFVVRGLQYSIQSDYDRAIADFNEAIRLDPKSADAFVGRGEVYRLQHDYAQAIADFSEAIRLDPQFRKAYRKRALAELVTHKWAEAKADLTRAHALDPDYGN